MKDVIKRLASSSANGVVVSFLVISAILVLAVVVGMTFGNLSTPNEMCNEAYEEGYLDACKDIYQGILKYDLVEHPDGTRVWEKVDGRSTETTGTTPESR